MPEVRPIISRQEYALFPVRYATVPVSVFPETVSETTGDTSTVPVHPDPHSREFPPLRFGVNTITSASRAHSRLDPLPFVKI